MSIAWNISTRTAKREDREAQLRRWVQQETERRQERARVLGSECDERPHVRLSL